MKQDLVEITHHQTLESLNQETQSLSRSCKMTTVGQIAQVYAGGTPSRNQPSYWNGDIPWVKTTQVQNRLITLNDVDEWI